MDVFGYNLEDKIGNNDLKRLNIVQYHSECPLSTPSLVIWHGSLKELADVIRDNAGVWALVVSTGPVPKQDLSEALAGVCGRVWTPGWDLASFEERRDRTPWQAQPAWKRALLESFISQVRTQSDGPPPWHQLEPPKVPQHVLSCYLCVVAGMDTELSWQRGFDEEVSYWTDEWNVNPRVDWMKDRTNKEKLRQFLAAVGALQTSAETWVSDAHR